MLACVCADKTAKATAKSLQPVQKMGNLAHFTVLAFNAKLEVHQKMRGLRLEKLFLFLFLFVRHFAEKFFLAHIL